MEDWVPFFVFAVIVVLGLGAFYLADLFMRRP